ncbi:hypothetical protein PRUPE_5G042600 [Prunus persica]|uniref:Peptidase C1A papain C-terminal domain-containing protein n=1 Tax=Prunus persica TaxID=3760 RepID=M5WTY2_PRUPE|nr:hypothetical protein PRUPE_5G042600 [Prunus persica]
MGFDKKNFDVCSLLILYLANSKSEAMSEEPPSPSPSPSPAATSILSEENPANAYSSDEEKERRFTNFKKSFNFVKNFMKGPNKLYIVGLNLFANVDEVEMEAFHYRVPIMDNLPLVISSLKGVHKILVEALHAITFNLQQPSMMSVQQLIDCNSSNYGCWGLNTKQNYPYWGIEGTCDVIKEKGDALNIDTYAIVTTRIEDKLAYTLYEQPMVVSVNAHNSKFEKYKGGIFHEECIIKNSWGEGGFMKLLKNDGTLGGHCGIALDASYPALYEDYVE